MFSAGHKKGYSTCVARFGLARDALGSIIVLNSITLFEGMLVTPTRFDPIARITLGLEGLSAAPVPVGYDSLLVSDNSRAKLKSV